MYASCPGQKHDNHPTPTSIQTRRLKFAESQDRYTVLVSDATAAAAVSTSRQTTTTIQAAAKCCKRLFQLEINTTTHASTPAPAM